LAKKFKFNITNSALSLVELIAQEELDRLYQRAKVIAKNTFEEWIEDLSSKTVGTRHPRNTGQASHFGDYTVNVEDYPRRRGKVYFQGGGSLILDLPRFFLEIEAPPGYNLLDTLDTGRKAIRLEAGTVVPLDNFKTIPTTSPNSLNLVSSKSAGAKFVTIGENMPLIKRVPPRRIYFNLTKRINERLISEGLPFQLTRRKDS